MQQPESVEQQIKWLQEQLEAKQKELVQGGEQRNERDVFKEVVRDISKDIASPGTSLPSPRITDDDAAKKALELEEKKHSEVVDNLIGIAFTKGIFSALAVAHKLKNPHLLDDFHDALVDHYYDTLIRSRSINAS